MRVQSQLFNDLYCFQPALFGLCVKRLRAERGIGRGAGVATNTLAPCAKIWRVLDIREHSSVG